MKVLLLGANGQLGWELFRTCPPDANIQTCDYPQIDFTSESSIWECVKKDRFDCIVNAAAYTAVDRAEKESKLAYQINEKAVEILAGLCKNDNIKLVHISTDFVFHGAHFKPYQPGDITEPQSVYGHSKLAGEQAIQRILGRDALIVRTAWLYSAHGRNFVKTMIRLMREKDKLTVIEDQIGTPTWAKGLANAIWISIKTGQQGIYHWTDAGVASWYDFAVAIQEEALALGLLDGEIPIVPIGTESYPTLAKRPYYSVLDKKNFLEKTGIRPVHWRKQLRNMLGELN